MNRVVSLQPSATVILHSLGLLQRVVACTAHCAAACPEAARVQVVVADSWAAQARQIAEARPDLVIAAVPYQAESVAQILQAGVRFLGLAPRTLQDIYGDIAAIAGVMQAPERGQQVMAEMQRQIAAVRETAQRAEARPRIFCEEWGKPIRASQPWVRELVEAAGGEFIGQAGAAMEGEFVRAADPDVLLFAWCGAGDRVPAEKVVEQRGWSDLRAVRAGRVFVVRDELLTTPAPVLVAGLRALAWALHPGLFPPAEGIRRTAPAVLK